MQENHLTVDPTTPDAALQPITQAGSGKVAIIFPPRGIKRAINDANRNIGGSRFLQKVLDLLHDGAD